MKIALVFDAPRGEKSPLERGVGGHYLSRTLDACAHAAGVDPEYRHFYAVALPQPGGKAPSIKDVRADRVRLVAEVKAWSPDKVISFGASALNAVAGGEKALAISKKRGVMSLAFESTPWVPTISHMAVIAHSDLHRDLANDVYKVMSQDAPLPPLNIDLMVPQTIADLEFALAELEGASAIGVDVETTGLRPAYDDLLAVGLGAVESDREGVAVVVGTGLLYGARTMQRVAELLWDTTWRTSRRSVGHNFKFDMQFLAPELGWPPDGASLGDTLLLAYLLDERPNRPTSRVRGLGLKELVATRYDHEYGFDFGVEVTEDRLDDMYAYLAEDVCYTARLWHDLTAEAEEESPRLLEVHDDLLVPVSRTIARAELLGAPVDKTYVTDTMRAYQSRIDRRKAVLEKTIVALAPTMVVDNILAPQQVADVMYDEWSMTPDVRKHGVLVIGDRSTDKDHIKSAVSKYLGTSLDRQARWLRSLELLRRDVRQRTTYEKSLLHRIDPDGRVRASFLIHGTSTGRLSSRDPNLQNVPSVDREDSISWKPMRRAFAPGPGRLWVEVDYSQLELRVAAALSEDAALTGVFTSGRDVHSEIATSIFHKPADQVSKGERFLAKAVSFGIIYGRGGKALSAGAEMRYAEQKLGMKAWSEDEANAFIKQFLRSYPSLTAWMERLYEEVPKAGYVESPYGRRRRFPLYPKSRGELGSIQRQGVNTPVQSAASDLCLEAMVELTEQLDHQDIDAKVLFTVHDSICMEVKEDDVEGLELLCRGVMEKDWHGVPLTVDFEAGPTWADVKATT